MTRPDGEADAVAAAGEDVGHVVDEVLLAGVRERIDERAVGARARPSPGSWRRSGRPGPARVVGRRDPNRGRRGQARRRWPRTPPLRRSRSGRQRTRGTSLQLTVGQASAALSPARRARRADSVGDRLASTSMRRRPARAQGLPPRGASESSSNTPDVRLSRPHRGSQPSPGS